MSACEVWWVSLNSGQSGADALSSYSCSF